MANGLTKYEGNASANLAMIWHFARKLYFDYGTHVFHRSKETAVCPINVFSINGGRKLYSCKDFQAILYTPLSIEVMRGEQLIHERTIFTDQIGKSSGHLSKYPFE